MSDNKEYKEWSANTLTEINNCKKTILKKKVLLNIVIEYYSWYDRWYRFFQMLVALAAPAVSFTDSISDSDSIKRNTTTFLGVIVIFMIKLKEYFKFDRLKDQGKQQTVKYAQLYDRIEREMQKTIETRQNPEEFIAWISRELSIIGFDDPDVQTKLKKKYDQICKENGIPSDDDLQMLTLISNAPLLQNTAPRAEELATSATPAPDEKQEYREQVETLSPRSDLRWTMERLKMQTN